MNYKRNSQKFSVKGCGKYLSKSDFILQYYTDIEKCRKFFFDMKWPTGFFCEKCGYTHFYYMKSKNCYRCANCGHDERLLANTIFQDNKLPLNVLLYGLFLIFTAKRSISSMELAEELKLNYKTACLLQTKCRFLMRTSNSCKHLDSNFYESDVIYTGAATTGHKRGMGTDKQPCLVVLATDQENQYPTYLKMHEMKSDCGNEIDKYFNRFVTMSTDRLLNTDGKTTYNVLKEDIQVNNEKVDYTNPDHRLFFLNKIVSNFNSTLIKVFHGIGKRMLPLYYNEFEYRYNHKHTRDYLSKIKLYIHDSTVHTRKIITEAMDIYYVDRTTSLC